MWQALQSDLRDRGLVVMAVAMDAVDAARPWIASVKPDYPCLIDENHHVADLFGMVNVPQAVWIDEAGRIVRPAESAGATDGFRLMDRQTFAIPQAVLDERARVRQRYFDAVRDWACGRSSARAVTGVSRTTAAVARAHAHFQLGQHLRRLGRGAEADAQFEEAVRLHPDSWNIWRRTAPKDERGLAAGPAFWARVDALGDRPYYAPVDWSSD